MYSGLVSKININQNVTDKANEKMEALLSEKCPTAQILMARPSPQKASCGKINEIKHKTDVGLYITMFLSPVGLRGTLFRGQVLVQVYSTTTIR